MFSLSPIIVLAMLVDEAHARLRLDVAVRLLRWPGVVWALNVIGEERARRAPPAPAPATVPDGMRAIQEAIVAVIPGSQGAQLRGRVGGSLGQVVAIQVFTPEAPAGRPVTDREWEALRAHGLALMPAVERHRVEQKGAIH